MQKIQPVRGTKDWFGQDKIVFNQIVELARAVSGRYDFQEIDTPIFEFSELFERNLGETSDVIAKEVYRFQDRGDNSLTLRPEFTAGIMRAFISNGELQQRLPVKLFSAGPLFRYDRPQQGRYRQFNQVNFEYLGQVGQWAEAELLHMLWSFLREVVDISQVTLEINHLGSGEDRGRYVEALTKYLERYRQDLSEDSQRRLVKNPLRILDSKDVKDHEILLAAPKLPDYYGAATQQELDNLLQLLSKLDIRFQTNSELVRGLDYYTGVVFEFTTQQLGAQGTLLAGGRYDHLASQLGCGTLVPAVGAAAGVERLMLLSKMMLPFSNLKGVILLGENENLLSTGFYLVETLRQTQKIRTYRGNNLKKLLARSAGDQLSEVYILGEDELLQGKIRHKDMQSGEEKLEELSTLLINKI